MDISDFLGFFGFLNFLEFFGFFFLDFLDILDISDFLGFFWIFKFFRIFRVFFFFRFSGYFGYFRFFQIFLDFFGGVRGFFEWTTPRLTLNTPLFTDSKNRPCYLTCPNCTVCGSIRAIWQQCALSTSPTFRVWRSWFSSATKFTTWTTAIFTLNRPFWNLWTLVRISWSPSAQMQFAVNTFTKFHQVLLFRLMSSLGIGLNTVLDLRKSNIDTLKETTFRPILEMMTHGTGHLNLNGKFHRTVTFWREVVRSIKSSYTPKKIPKNPKKSEKNSKNPKKS